MGICTLCPRVGGAVLSSRDHVHHLIPILFVLSWLGGVPFVNGLVSRAYACFMKACKRDCGKRKVKSCNAILTSRAQGCTGTLVCFVRSSPRGLRSASLYETSPAEVTM